MTAQPTPAPQLPAGKTFPASGLPYLDLVSFGLAAIALYAVLALGLLPAFITGVLVYELVHVVAPIVRRRGFSHRTGKIAALIFLTFAFVLLIAAATLGMTSMLTDSSDNVVILLRKMAEIVQTAKTYLPVWVHEYIPASAEDWQTQASQWLRANAGALQGLGENLGRFFFHIIVGAVVGALAALGPIAALPSTLPPLRGALLSRAQMIGTSFRRVVFAQVRISAINTILTGTYLLIFLPMIGVHLPFVKTMVAITFIAGLLPVIGNLISNTVIVVVSLGVSAYAAVGSLVFLVVIHKLEYFFNARIIGSQISSRAWELLIAMLVMEAWFGVPGIIAAPIYYAYIKNELSERGLI